MAKVCVFLHGYLTNYQDFTSLPHEIMEDYDQVILLCLPGHECKETLKNFTKEKVFAYIEQEMNKILPQNEVDVVGFSLGGALAWYISLHYPIHKLVLLSPAVTFFNIKLLKERYLYRKTLYELPKEEREENLKKFRGRDVEALRFIKTQTFPKFNFKNGFQFCEIIREIRRTKGNITIPLLIVRGDLDELVPKVALDECYNRCNHFKKEIYTLPDIGHMLLRTHHQQEIVQKVKQFLEEQDYE